MFDNNNPIFAYKIELQLDPYLVALFNLCFDISIKLGNVTNNEGDVKHAVSLFSDDFYEMLGVNKNTYLSKDEEGQYIYTKEDFFTNVATNLNSYYLKNDEFISKLKTKDFLYFFKDTFFIYSTLPTKREVKNSLNDKFKTVNVIGKIVDSFKDEKLRDSLKNISAIYELNKTGQYIVVSEENSKPQLLYIKDEWLNYDLLRKVDVDIDNIWIHYENELNSKLNFDIENDEYFLIIDKALNDKVIGLKVNDYILLKYDVDCKNYIKEEYSNQYLWQLFKENYFRQRPKTFSCKSELIKSFKQKSKEDDFNKLLCNLKHNLYINRSIEIETDYRDFFEEFIILKDLKHFPNCNFFLPDTNVEKEFLGIYTEQKIDKKYNLLHIFRHKGNGFTEDFVNSMPQSQKKEKVYILKAELAFFLIEKYFEDIIEELLSEQEADYVSNVELCINGVSKVEFDFVIFVNEKFYVLETKTTLTKDNVYETLKKYNDNDVEYLKYIVDSDLNNFSFALLGFLSNDNLENYKHFFDDKDQDYNTEREGFVITPYRFKVPFFSHPDLELECIAEPQLSKLKEFIEKICQI